MNLRLIAIMVMLGLFFHLQAEEKWHFLMTSGDKHLFSQIIEVQDDSVIISQRNGKRSIAIDEIAVLRKENPERSILPLSGCLAGCVAGSLFGLEKVTRDKTVLRDVDNIPGSAFLGAVGGLAVAVILTSKIDFENGTDFSQFLPEERRQHLQAIVELYRLSR